jgi:hypothetical protein
MPGKFGALITSEAGAGVKASNEIKGFRPESIMSRYQHDTREQHYGNNPAAGNTKYPKN